MHTSGVIVEEHYTVSADFIVLHQMCMFHLQKLNLGAVDRKNYYLLTEIVNLPPQKRWQMF